MILPKLHQNLKPRYLINKTFLMINIVGWKESLLCEYMFVLCTFDHRPQISLQQDNFLCIVDYESLKSMHNAFDSQNKSKDPMIYRWYNTCMCNLFGHICFKCTFWFRRKYSQILIRLIFIYRVCAQNIWVSISLQREFCECTL